MAAYGVVDAPPDRQPRQQRHGQRQPGHARRSTRRSRSARPACPAIRSSSATRPRRPRADEVTLLAATLVAQTAYELFADPALVEAAWASSADADGADVSGRAAASDGLAAGTAGAYHRRRRAPLDAGCEPAAPPETDRSRPAAGPAGPPAPSPGGLSMAERHDPDRPSGFAAAERLGPRLRGLHRLRPADLRRADHVHEAALDHGSRPSSCAGGPTSRSSARRSTTRSATGPAPGSARGRSARRSTRRARSTRSSSASSRSRSSTSSTPATRTSCRPGSSGRTR